MTTTNNEFDSLEPVGTFTIPEWRMDEFKSRFTKLQKKARKLGVAEPTFTVIKEFTKSYTFHPITDEKLTFPLVLTFFEIELEGKPPKFAGWKFVATIEHLGEDNIIKTIPGEESLSMKYRTDSNTCDHCHKIRSRKSTYIVRHEETGEEKRIGSTCIKDFLGHSSPEHVAQMCAYLWNVINEAEDCEGFGGGRFDWGISIAHWLTVSAAIIRTSGWKSRGQVRNESEMGMGGGSATADIANEYVFGKGKSADQLRRDIPLTDGDTEIAAKAREWAITIDPNTSSDYLHNLLVIAKRDELKIGHLGLASAMVFSYLKEVNKLEEKKRLEQVTGVSEHISEVGKRLEMTVRVIGVYPKESDWGLQTIVKFIVNGKDKAVWFASGDPGYKLGEVVKVKATVKKHTEYQGTKETSLNRVTCIEMVEEANTMMKTEVKES
jgi:hypothetical protein